MLQGTIYSDGRSSTVLSPNNIHEEGGGAADSNTLDQRIEAASEPILDLSLRPPSATKSPYKEVVAVPVSPEHNKQQNQQNPIMIESADSSLLISEETQANKRTQSSCKKTKIGQM